MIINMKRTPYVYVFTVLAGLYISGCTPTRLDIIPIEQVQQIETEKTTKSEPSEVFTEAKTSSSRIIPAKHGYGYLGLGVISGDVSVDDGPYEDMDSGIHLLLGVKGGHFSVEFNIGIPSDNEFLGVGLKLDILPFDKYKWSPWVGVDAYIMEMDFFTNEDRGCFSPVVGLDVRLAKGLVLRGGAGKCSYTKDRSWPFGRSIKKDMKLYTIDLIFRRPFK